MTLGGKSVETVAIAFDFVAEREGADPDIFGLVDELWGVTFYRMEDDIVAGLIKESYDLVVSKLPKATRQKYI